MLVEGETVVDAQLLAVLLLKEVVNSWRVVAHLLSFFLFDFCYLFYEVKFEMNSVEVALKQVQETIHV